jgi:hypothetical protein
VIFDNSVKNLVIKHVTPFNLTDQRM